MNYVVYWLKSEEHQDPHSEGYIGVTRQRIERRMSKHHVKKANPTCQVVILHERLTSVRACRLERRYRPTTGIGWNTCRGGEHL